MARVLEAGKMLHTNSALTALDLGGNRVEAEAALALADALRVNKKLTTLDLGGNPIWHPTPGNPIHCGSQCTGVSWQKKQCASL